MIFISLQEKVGCFLWCKLFWPSIDIYWPIKVHPANIPSTSICFFGNSGIQLRLFAQSQVKKLRHRNVYQFHFANSHLGRGGLLVLVLFRKDLWSLTLLHYWTLHKIDAIWQKSFKRRQYLDLPFHSVSQFRTYQKLFLLTENRANIGRIYIIWWHQE